MMVCCTDRLFHYLLGGDGALESILERGLLPLSSFPESERWRQIERVHPGFYKWIYETFAEPVIKKPYTNSGIFLTPIDFRRLPESSLARAARVVLPVSAIEPSSAGVTYELDGQRVVLPLSPDTLQETARLWPPDMVRNWFGRDRSKLFYHVPQVAAYQEGGIAVKPEWVEPRVTD